MMSMTFGMSAPFTVIGKQTELSREAPVQPEAAVVDVVVVVIAGGSMVAVGAVVRKKRTL